MASDTWGVWGFVIGGTLPAERLHIGEAEIARLSGAELQHVLRKNRVRPYMAGIKIGHQVLPSQLHVYSEWVARWGIEAESAELAEQCVLVHRLPRLLTALNSLPGAPYRVEIMRIGRVDLQRGTISQERSLWHGGTVGFGPSVLSLVPTEEAALQARHEMLKDEELWHLAKHYQDGLLLSDLWSGLPPTMAAASLTSFHRFIEGVVNHILSRTQDVGKSGPFRARVGTAVKVIGGEDDLTVALNEFYTFRNAYFAHSGPEMDDSSAHEWTTRAGRICREVLCLWLDHLAGQRYPDPPLGAGRELLLDGSQSDPVTAKWPSLS